MTDDLIDRLVADLRPIRRSGGTVMAVLGLILVQTGITIALGKVRPDLAVDGGSVVFVWRLLGAALVATICVVVALRFRNPALALGNWPIAIAAALIGFVGLGWALDLSMPSAAAFATRLRPALGLNCMLTVVAQGMPTLFLVGWLLRRGAIVRPEAAATAAGLGAAGVGGTIWAMGCSIDDPVYVVFWYSVTFAIMTLAARLMLPRLIQLR